MHIKYLVILTYSVQMAAILVLFVYQMGRLCGGAHEISGIKASLFLHGWVGVGGGVVYGCL